MSNVILKASETRILQEAAANGGRVVLPNHLKESTRERIAGLFAKHALAEAAGDDGALRLTPAGYLAVGLKPPRTARAKSAAISGETPAEAGSGTGEAESAAGSGEARVSKREVVLGLLGRPDGASLDEMIAATGWLPHTTRAALSRLRSGGQALVRSKREDGTSVYRILPPEPAASARRSRKTRPEAAVERAA